VLQVGRASLHRAPTVHRRPVAVDPPWVEPLRQLIQQHPTFGYRHLWALLRGQTARRVNKKAVYRVLKISDSPVFYLATPCPLSQL
jgi:putative transposase